MEKELEEASIYSFEINNNNLKCIKEIIENDKFYLTSELEIDPFDSFSLEFSAAYWYLKYHLLRDGKILISEDDFYFFEEDNLNIIFFNLTDFKSFSIECIDGIWCLKIIKIDPISISIYQKLKKHTSVVFIS